MRHAVALNLAHYEMRYGALPLDDTLGALSAAEPNDDQAEMLTRGMQNLVGLLGNVLSGLGEERTDRAAAVVSVTP